MKKLITSVLSLAMLLGIGLSTTGIKAATNTEEGKTTSEDGTIIQYSDTAINGGVDLNTRLNLSDDELINKKNIPTTRGSSVVISIPFQTQQNDYYCGPASARMVLGGMGYNVSQDYMASLLGTTASDGTYAGDGVVNALNRVVSGSRFQFRWQWHTYTNVGTIKGHVVEALDYGNPVMVNTVESPGDVYLVGHDIGVPLYHFGVVADYFDYGNSVTYTDPGYGRYSGFVMDQRASITNLSYAAGGRGYAW